MQPEIFRAPILTEALAVVRARLGEDAIILRTSRDPRTRAYEVAATSRAALREFEDQLQRHTPRTAAPRARRQRVIALVGPAGGGKTTTAVKLALGARGFGGSRVGIISLDTYRIGAAEQIQIYADIAQLPLETVAEAGEAQGALRRLGQCDVIIVDAPGRGPRAMLEERAWIESLHRLQPDEVHLVLPATTRLDIALATRTLFDRAAGLTHLLLTRLDEVPGDGGIAEIAAAIDLPARWVCDGQHVPDELHAAPQRIISALCRDGSAHRRGAA